MASLKSNSSVTVCDPDDASLYEKASGLEAIGKPAILPTPCPSPTLAPVDRGFAAWATLAASCLMGLFVFGFPNSAGVLLAAYLDDPLYTTQKNATTLLPLIGTFNMGILYCGGVLITPSIRCYPRLRKVYTWTGIAVCFLSLLTASFTTDVRMLIASEGLTFGVGAALVYCPLVSYMTEWFVERRGLANGILFAADNAGGMLFPVIMPLLISRFGVAMTLRIYGIALVLCLLPAALLLKARMPESLPNISTSEPKLEPRHWLRDRRFWFFISLNTLQGLAHFVPLTWLPTFAASLGVSESNASLVLTLTNGAMTLSGFAAGWLSDRVSIWALAVGSLLLSTLATFVLWGVVAASYAGVLAFGVAYGLTAGCWSSMWSGFVRPVAGDDASLATTIFSLLLFTRGIGNVVSTPISTALQSVKIPFLSSSAPRIGFAADDSHFAAVIIYTGACFAMAVGVATVGWALDRRPEAKQVDEA
ncbi:MFS general substrate transporter [Phanerochaete sordida]|uniref:MFS general substrate transporter n=1 Tax=Phanerochaete sordida TaxID=48140 RepID=A0A9P3LL01_9APHY|nr:MFS general substrate transporter [Phanerochaete sordida]